MPTNCTDCRYRPLVGCNPYQDNGLSPSDHRHRTCPLTELSEPSGDLISRADAIEAVQKLIRNNQTEITEWLSFWVIDEIRTLPAADAVSREDYHNLLTASDDIDRALREYQAKEEQLSAEAEWIPCSERLPKHGDDVLVTYSDGEVSIVMGARSKYWMKWEARENSNLIFPIAWKPLPKPYREKSEVEE